MEFPPFPGCPQFINSSSCFQLKKKTTTGVGEMDQQLKTHAVLIENLGLIPAPMWQIKRSVTLISGDLTPSVASVDTARIHGTLVHMHTKHSYAENM